MGVTVGCDRRHFGKGVGLHYLSDNELVSWDELGWVTGSFCIAYNRRCSRHRQGHCDGMTSMESDMG